MRHANVSVRQERPGESRPSGLVRGAETFSSLAVEILAEEKRVSPHGIVLEARVCSMRRPPDAGVEQKQAQQTAPEFIGDLSQIRLPA